MVRGALGRSFVCAASRMPSRNGCARAQAADVRGVGVLDEDSFFRKLIGFRVGLPLDTVSTLAQEFWNADFHGVDYNVRLGLQTASQEWARSLSFLFVNK